MLKTVSIKLQIYLCEKRKYKLNKPLRNPTKNYLNLIVLGISLFLSLTFLHQTFFDVFKVKISTIV